MFQFCEGSKNDTHMLGMKGANLCEIARYSLRILVHIPDFLRSRRVAPVPEGFIISTSFCEEFYKNSGLTVDMRADIMTRIGNLESQTGLKFGNVKNGQCPLLLSLRASPMTIING